MYIISQIFSKIKNLYKIITEKGASRQIFMSNEPLNVRLFKNAKLFTLILGIAALFGGIVNGFLGTGGGIILMLALGLMPTADDNSIRDRFATVIAVILPLSVISAVTYGDKLNFSAASSYILPGILGGIAGGLLLDKMSVKIVKKLFALMVIWAGINFLMK